MFRKELDFSKIKIYYALVFILVLLVIGTFLFHNLENLNYVDSFYFTTSTLTTVGYGDIVPTHDVSKIVTSIYSLLGVAIFLFILGLVTEYYFYRRFTSYHEKIENKKKK